MRIKRTGGGVSRIRQTDYGSSWNKVSSELKSIKGRVCSRCGHTGNSINKLNTHHILARARGGPDSEANTVILCEDCHSLAHPKNKGLRALRRKIK